MSPPLHRSAQRVADALRTAGATGEVREFAVPTRTSAEAAAALGCELAAIASCLVFVADDEPIVVIKSGAHRVDLEHLGRQLGGATVHQADADEVRAVTGQPIGGVAPVNWPTSPRVLIDATLEPIVEVWAAAGTPNAVFPTTYDELRRLTGATPVTVVARTGR
ncbi:MAG TPA: YbaK/EbsC family protein [Acidimicrobiales bacterium]|nr:YbaK/EbsC family protein [Acidimicrobiales bacterium]